MPDVIAGIVLAAGASSRMGRPKALLPIGGDTFVTRIARTLAQAGADPLVVVAGAAAGAVRDALNAADVPATLVVNPAPERGQLSSLQAALSVLDDRVDAALVCLVDAPLVTAGTVARVMAAFRQTRAPVVRPASGTQHGHPVLFARTLFDELRDADPAVGAKAVVRAHAADAVAIEVEDPGAFLDIDTPADYNRWITADADKDEGS